MKTFMLPSLTLGALCLAATFTSAIAQQYPTHPIRMVIPFSPGGATDTPGRIVATKLSEMLGQNIVVENRPGAGSTIGTASVAQAPGDGYTLLFTATTFVLGPSLYKNLSYDVLTSFEPIAQTGSAPMALIVNPSLPVKSVKDLIMLARSKPLSIRIASSGNGSTQQLFAALFMSMSGAKMQFIPYRGSAQAMTAVLSGEVSVGVSSIPRTLGLASSGKLRILGVTGDKRSSQLPDVPTIDEAGVNGYSATLWVGLLAPKGTPAQIIKKLSRDVGAVLKLPEVEKAYQKAGIDVVYRNSDEFGKFIKAEYGKWSKVMQQTGATIN